MIDAPTDCRSSAQLEMSSHKPTSGYQSNSPESSFQSLWDENYQARPFLPERLWRRPRHSRTFCHKPGRRRT